MAGNMNRVKDMYEGVNYDRMTDAEKKAHREGTLQDNPDVLFRVYRDGRLHMVMFRPSDPGVWMSVIRSRITTNLSLQLTNRRAVHDIFTTSLSGSEEELRSFCEAFKQMHEKVMRNMQEDEVEQLRERIRELELENKKLRKK